MKGSQIMEGKGFFSSLFDLSFTEFVTTRIIKVLFVLCIIGSGLAALGILIGSFRTGAGGVIIGLIVAAITFLLSVLASRIWLEVIIVLFRIAENTARMAEQSKGVGSPAKGE